MRKILGRFAAVALGILLALVGLEIGLRVTDSVPKQRNSRRAFHDTDPELGWVGTKNYVAQFRRGEFDVRVEIDENGFRRVGTPFTGPADAPRIAFLGDSFTWGFGMEQGECFVDRIQALLGGRARLENYGITAYSSGQQRLLLERLIEEDPPEIVMLMFFPNDLEENGDPWEGRRPWYELQGDDIVLRNHPVDRQMSGWAYRVMRRSLALTHLRYYANVLSNELREPRTASAQSQGQPPAGLDEAEWRHLWRIEELILADIARLCAEAAPAIDLRVVYLPERGDLLGAVEGEPEFDHRGELARICGELGVAYFDLTPGFREAWLATEDRGEIGQPLFFETDGHWASDGHALAASLLFEGFPWPEE